MKAILAAAGFSAALLGAAPVAAQEGLPDVRTMTCGQVQSFIKARRAVVMRTGPTTYDRFVSEDILCRPDAYGAPDFERTLDNSRCMIGYYCHQYEENNR
jgi:hypothetical protein